MGVQQVVCSMGHSPILLGLEQTYRSCTIIFASSKLWLRVQPGVNLGVIPDE